MTATHMQRARSVVQRRFNCFYLIDIASPADGGRDSLRGQNPFTEAFFFSSSPSLLSRSCLSSPPKHASQATRHPRPGTHLDGSDDDGVASQVPRPSQPCSEPTDALRAPRTDCPRRPNGCRNTGGAPRTKAVHGYQDHTQDHAWR